MGERWQNEVLEFGTRGVVHQIMQEGRCIYPALEVRQQITINPFWVTTYLHLGAFPESSSLILTVRKGSTETQL